MDNFRKVLLLLLHEYKSCKKNQFFFFFPLKKVSKNDISQFLLLTWLMLFWGPT